MKSSYLRQGSPNLLKKVNFKLKSEKRNYLV